MIDEYQSLKNKEEPYRLQSFDMVFLLDQDTQRAVTPEFHTFSPSLLSPRKTFQGFGENTNAKKRETGYALLNFITIFIDKYILLIKTVINSKFSLYKSLILNIFVKGIRNPYLTCTQKTKWINI